MTASPIDYDIPNVHPRVGELVEVLDAGTHKVGPSQSFAPPSYGVIVYWPKSHGAWFRVQAEADSGGVATKFGDLPRDLLTVIRQHNCEESALAQVILNEDWVDENWALAGSVSAQATIRLKFIINTNNETCIKELLKSADGESPTIRLTVLYFDADAPQPDDQTIVLHLTPGTPTPKSTRLIGLDLGNTSSALAVIDPLDIDGDPTRPLTKRVPMLTARLSAGGGSIGHTDTRGAPVPSELRFLKFLTWPDGPPEPPRNRRYPDAAQYPDDDMPNSADFMMGELARHPSAPARSVVMGAKRMGSTRPKKQRTPQEGPVYPTHAVNAAHRIIAGPEPSEAAATIQLDVRAPLELLACRMLQHFREAHRTWPAKIALTYPTTYTRFELQSLRQAVQKGWLRMQAIGQRSGSAIPPHDIELIGMARELQQIVNNPPDLASQSKDPLIKLLLDEASAAAFFFVYRKMFEEMTGGMAAFRYLYEAHGLNMLLYDCGGGTTDIALVNVRVESDLKKLRFNVLRRSGDRTFGGDNITRQVCRLAKAKLMHLLATERKKGGNLPPQPMVPLKAPADKAGWLKLAGELEAFIVAMGDRDPNDELIPTRNLPNQAPTEDRRAAALALWRLGEHLKHGLSSEIKAANGAMAPVADYKLPSWEKSTNKLSEILLAGTTEQVVAMKKKLDAISISRIEIDALIYEPMMKGIRNCNKLIHEVFDSKYSDEATPQEVHWVVVSGNSVRYPFLQQTLRRNLAVPFLEDEQRFTFDPTNAKDATAKGAALALATMEGDAQIEICFDSGLANRLPFDVGHQTKIIGAVKSLFEEHALYFELHQREPVKIPVAELSQSQIDSKRFILQRKFPGDDGFHNFLAFEFADGIQGPHLSVSYDDASEFEFRVVDGRGNEGIAVDQTAGELYVAPAQRGDI